MSKVLIIESDDALRKYISEKLKQHKFDVILCRDGFEGIIKIKNELPDLIIMDLILERMDAFKLLKEKLDYKTTNNIPVIVITQNNDAEINQKLNKLKVNKVLFKPLKIDLLWQYISELFKVKLNIDQTTSLIDVHLNDDVLFIEIANGLNIEKIGILRYRISQINRIYNRSLTKILVILTHIDYYEEYSLKLNLLFDIITEETSSVNRGIKILSSSESISSLMSKTNYSDIEIFNDFAKAIDSLGKVDIFAYGNELDEIKAQLLSTIEDSNNHEHSIEFAFSSEKIQVKDSYKIAIVDDDLYILEFMATVLDRENWIISTYENAQAFLRDVTDNKPDLLFLDLMMPKMNGFQLTQYLMEKNIYIPIVIVTALSQKEMVFKAREFGITNFMTKPIKAEALINKAEELLKMTM